jgi:hypothetical protein
MAWKFGRGSVRDFSEWVSAVESIDTASVQHFGNVPHEPKIWRRLIRD